MKLKLRHVAPGVPDIFDDNRYRRTMLRPTSFPGLAELSHTCPTGSLYNAGTVKWILSTGVCEYARTKTRAVCRRVSE